MANLTRKFPFVLHYHTGYGEAHYDLMLHYGDALATWQLKKSLNDLTINKPIKVNKIIDHRLVYLTYEGPISRGRGQIKKIDFGYYQPIKIEPNNWEFILIGQVSNSRYKLEKYQSENDVWILTKNFKTNKEEVIE